MSGRRIARGQPLIVLVMILTSWVATRAMIIESELVPPVRSEFAGVVSVLPRATVAAQVAQPVLVQSLVTAPAQAVRPELVAIEFLPAPARQRPALVTPITPVPAPVPIPAVAVTVHQGAGPVTPDVPAKTSPAPLPARVAAGHQLLWMAALSQLPTLGEINAAAARARPQAVAGPVAQNQTPPVSRWSGDAWLLYRTGGTGLLAGGFAPPTYGASQAGAVLRYRLDPGSDHRPALYLRATSGIAVPRGEEAALGLSVRPVAGLPVAALTELRATQFGGQVRLRPAATLVSELPSFALPGGLRGEVYVQGGYVGGTGATGFVDGQIKVDRRLARIGRADLRLGGGVWGGAQQGAARLDAGPSASLGLPLGGPASARLAMDWRFRLTGSAAPQSGPAVTLSAGF